MASTAGCEIVKSEVRISILTVIPRKKGEQRGISHVQEPVKLSHLKKKQDGAMRAMRSLHTESNTERSEVKLGYSESHRGSLLTRKKR